jgi:hypothetical protein
MLSRVTGALPGEEDKMKRPSAGWHSTLARHDRVGRLCTPVDLRDIDYASFKFLGFRPARPKEPR